MNLWPVLGDVVLPGALILGVLAVVALLVRAALLTLGAEPVRAAAHAAVREQVLDVLVSNTVGRDIVQRAVSVALDAYEDALFSPIADQSRRGWAVMDGHRPWCVLPTRRAARRQRKHLAVLLGCWTWQLRIEPTEVFDPLAVHTYQPTVPAPQARRNQDAQSATW